jgi:hypothetical protein
MFVAHQVHSPNNNITEQGSSFSRRITIASTLNKNPRLHTANIPHLFVMQSKSQAKHNNNTSVAMNKANIFYEKSNSVKLGKF